MVGQNVAALAQQAVGEHGPGKQSAGWVSSWSVGGSWQPATGRWQMANVPAIASSNLILEVEKAWLQQPKGNQSTLWSSPSSDLRRDGWVTTINLTDW